MNPPTEHAGKFRCGLSSQGVFRFTLEDEQSSGTMVVVSISPGDLALALSGRGDLPCRFEVKPKAVANVGLRRIDRLVGIDHAEASERARRIYASESSSALFPKLREHLQSAVGHFKGQYVVV